MDRLEDLLRRIRDPRERTELLLGAAVPFSSFERVASLVLLALLCTTLAGMP